MTQGLVNKSGFYQPLSVVTGPPQRILTSKKFLGIGDDVGADEFKLIIRIPGDEDEKLLVINWRQNAQIEPPQVKQLTSLEEPIIEEVLKSGKEVHWENGYEYIGNERYRCLREDERGESVVAVPLEYQGEVTGFAWFQFRSGQELGEQNLLKIREFAIMAALVAQGEREVSAVDRFSTKLIRWRVGEDVMNNRKAIDGIAKILRSILSPVAVIIDLNAGFKRYLRLVGINEEANQALEDLKKGLRPVIRDPNSSFEIIEIKLLDVAQKEDEEDDDHADNVEKKEGLQIGSVYLLVERQKGGIFTRGASYSSRRAIATQVTDALLNAIRDGFHSLNRNLGIALNDRDLSSSSQWFSEIEKIAGEARLLWTVATGIGNNEIYGKPDAKKIVQTCLEKIEIDSETGHINQINEFARVIDAEPENMSLMLLNDSGVGEHRIITVYLPHTKARIWFGVEREEFGRELTTLSPWAVFIDRIAEMADSALLRLKMQQIQNEAAETRFLATYVVTSHTVFHQFANMVRDIANPITSLKEAAEAGVLVSDRDVIDLIYQSNQSADRLLDLAHTFLNVNKMDTQRPCSLLKVINESRELLIFSLKTNQISFDVNIVEDLILDVPFSVAFLAIANLLSNAKDAIGKRGGRIWIEAEIVGDMVHCYVFNDGPPVDAAIRSQIFHKIGISTKQGQNIHGWGLYLAYKGLIESHGHIELTSSDEKQTKFTIRFPRTRQEQA